MEKILFTFSVIILLFSFFYSYKTYRKLTKEKEKIIEKLIKEEENKFEEKRKELVKGYNEELLRINQERTSFIQLNQQERNHCQVIINSLNEQIQEKQNFNNSLQKIREEELDRIIQTKKEEKEKQIELQIKQKEKEQIELLNAEFNKFKNEQEEIKKQLLEETSYIKEEFEEFRIQRAAIHEAILREKELKEKEDYYKIIISENDREDIETLKSIGPRLRNREALNKLIYDVFIKRPLNELIKRVTSGKEISGIYKITYIKTGESYIGKTTNISTRWQNHIKTACGLEGAAHSTFHTRLEQDGIWNYTFEILEEVSKDKLSEREKFYIDLYNTDKQLNMRKG